MPTQTESVTMYQLVKTTEAGREPVGNPFPDHIEATLAAIWWFPIGTRYEIVPVEGTSHGC